MGNNNNGTGKHAFYKFLNPNNSNKKNGNDGKRKGKESSQAKSDCGNSVFPMGYCSICGKFKESQGHHSKGVPEWIRRRFERLGVFIEEALKINTCPRCHNKIERNRQNYQAVVISRHIKQLTEIDQLFLNGRENNLTFEELTILADGGSLMSGIADEQIVTQEVAIREEN